MALGGGQFITQSKILPGSYINFVSAAQASATLSDRGIAAIPYVGSWGPEDEVFEVTSGDFQKNSMQIFGYSYTAPELQMFREIFKNAKALYTYRVNTGTVKASNAYAEAKYGGVRGNALTIVIDSNIDSGYDVKTFLEGSEVDSQTVADASKLSDNSYVTFKKDATLALTAGTPLTGGTDGTNGTGDSYQKFLDKMESYSFHALGCTASDPLIVDLFVAFTNGCGMKLGSSSRRLYIRLRERIMKESYLWKIRLRMQNRAAWFIGQQVPLRDAQ